MKQFSKIVFAFSFLIGFGLLLTGCGSPAGTVEDAQAKKDEAVQLIYQRDLEQAVVKLEEAENILSSLDTTEELAMMKLETAEIFRYTEDYDSAAEKLTAAITLFETLDKKERMADAYNVLGIISKDQEKYKEAMENYEKAAELYTEVESNNDLIAQNNIADLYTQKGEYEEALVVVDSTLVTARERELINETALLTVTRGEIFTKQGDDEMALLHFQDAWEMVKDSANQRIQGLAFQFMQKGHLQFNFVEPKNGECDATTSELRDEKCYCLPRFSRNWHRTACDALPENAYFVNSNTDTWFCAPNTHEENGACIVNAPPVVEEVPAEVPAETPEETPAE